ncbi:ABC transporter permease [Brachybacterium fresconis]|uniref:ABC-2 type transport system permease protein n=1 Tax=Brachybacterium fresconis TaxID=173363 RepID=A0ABS4YFG3_9MICO|nr:polyketide antibiotic transporter [Brachybacterium fresconis]MBP2407519.1 ABC-2 type transport system permease protein [Brachybacterium fresconis]
MSATDRATAARHTHLLEVRPTSPLTGIGALVRLFGRISRRQIIIWALAMVVTVAASVVALKEAYPDQEALDARAALLGNPSAVLMTGPAFARDHYTLWAAVANELFLYVLLAGAIMSILLTVRHTRAEEEAGRLEMLRSLPTGRLAPAAAALVVVAIANLVLGAAVSIAVLVTGAPVLDGIALGAATALTGLVFAGIAAVAAQVTEHGGTASGLALGALAVAFLVRGVGDVIEEEGSWLSWFSPLAWAQQSKVFVEVRWWPLAVSVAAIFVLVALAAVLSRRRDLGSGLRPAAAGPDAASAALRAPGGLARRLVTPMMVTWAIGLFLFAIAFGSLASSLEDMVEQIPTIGEFAPIDVDDLTRSFTGYILLMLALGPVGLIVSGVLRLRSEEQEGRMAGTLLAGIGRITVALRWVVVVTLEVFALQVLLGLGTGIGVWQATGETSWIGESTLAALAYLPAIAFTGALTLALYGLRVRLAGLAWLMVIWAALDTFLGDLLQLPQWARNLSVLHHVPAVPDADLEVTPLAVMAALAVLLTVVGLGALRRRDLVAG